jgi:hypothetical protein
VWTGQASSDAALRWTSSSALRVDEGGEWWRCWWHLKGCAVFCSTWGLGTHQLKVAPARGPASGGLDIENSSARILPKDTVVFLRTASVGLCARLGAPGATSQHFANFVCGPRVDPRYLVQVFRHMEREWRRLSAGSVLPDVYMPTFKRLKVLLPPRDEQDAIAEAGEAFDQRIGEEQVQLEKLRALHVALLQGLLSGQVPVPERVMNVLAAGGEPKGAKVG